MLVKFAPIRLCIWCCMTRIIVYIHIVFRSHFKVIQCLFQHELYWLHSIPSNGSFSSQSHLVSHLAISRYLCYFNTSDGNSLAFQWLGVCAFTEVSQVVQPKKHFGKHCCTYIWAWLFIYFSRVYSNRGVSMKMACLLFKGLF